VVKFWNREFESINNLAIQVLAIRWQLAFQNAFLETLLREQTIFTLIKL
jgi:hypothetical protein